jgi:hypothetical protein
MTAILAASLLIALAPAAIMLNLCSDQSPFTDNSFLMALNPMIESILNMF